MSFWARIKKEQMSSKNPLDNFSLVVKNSHRWKELTSLAEARQRHPLGKGNSSFLFGISTSTYQDSGAMNCPHSQWSFWEKEFMKESNFSGQSANLFQVYQEDPRSIIDRLKLLGVNAYRFSVEWSHIESHQGKFDQTKLEVYVNFCKELRNHGITPMITLHHFSEPLWFHDKGSFENEENIPYLTSFCEKVFSVLIQPYEGKPLVEFFCTINEPSIEALCRYILGKFSPGLKWQFRQAGIFLKNILKAHCLTYRSLKRIALSQKAPSIQIGITHQYLSFEALQFPVRPLTKALSLMHEAVLHLFKTGKFRFHIPFLCRIKEDFTEMCSVETDFVGAQFYGRVYIGIFGPSHPQKAEITDMEGLYEDPAGLYEAIVEIYKAFRVPIIVTENGISTQSEHQRKRYLERALYAAEKASQKIGPENLLGYFLWSFNDNFEWEKGWNQKFGAFSFEKDGQTSPQYKPGIEPFVETIKSWNRSLNRN